MPEPLCSQGCTWTNGKICAQVKREGSGVDVLARHVRPHLRISRSRTRVCFSHEQIQKCLHVYLWPRQHSRRKECYDLECQEFRAFLSVNGKTDRAETVRLQLYLRKRKSKKKRVRKTIFLHVSVVSYSFLLCVPSLHYCARVRMIRLLGLS